MVALFIYTLVALTVYLYLPTYISNQTGRPAKTRGLLAIGCLLFVSSLYIPSPLIHGQDTNFSSHFFGGGIFTGLIWLFLKENLSWKLTNPFELLSLYFLVSGLGVANEIFEFAANGIGIIHIPSNDTWWDLFANLLGAFTFWVFYKLGQKNHWIK